MSKDNIIQFPIKERMQQIADEVYEEDMEMEYFTNDCIDTSQLILTIIEELITEEETSPFKDMNFRNKDVQESKDIFVIVNLLSSMFMRYGGMNHFLHEYMDIIYEKLMEQQGYNDFT